VRFAVNVPPFAEPEALVDLAVAAERAGWDAMFLWDHVVLEPAGAAIVDPWVVLGAIATRTTRIRIGTCVTPLARRRVQVVARETVTLDRLSGGRLVLGVGLGVPPAEYTTFGEDADPRVLAERLDESLTVLDGLWSGEPIEHHGRHLDVGPVRFLPRPAQLPRPPVWVACMLPARGGLRRAARWDGIVPMRSLGSGIGFLDPDDIAALCAEVRSQRGSLDGFDVVVNAGPPPCATVEDFERAGATWWMASMDDSPGWFDLLLDIVSDGPPR